MYFEPSVVAGGRTDLQALAGDISRASSYGDTHCSRITGAEAGWLFGPLVDPHRDAGRHLDDLLTASNTLLSNAADRVDRTLLAYAETESDNTAAVSDIWAVLQTPSGETPIGPPEPGGTVTRGPLPSEGLEAPEEMVGHWIWDVLSWPDYLSAGSWVRKILGWIWQAFTGEDPWQWVWQKLAGDWDLLGLVGDAWKELAGYMGDLSDEVVARMQLMFAGWYDSEAATASGGYFAAAAQALSEAADPLAELGRLYESLGHSSFFLFQAVFSAIDAAIDAVIVYLLGGVTVAEVLAAFFSGGATAVPAAATAVITAVQAVSSAWGWMMTGVYGVAGLASLLGAVTTDVTWTTLPEG